MFPTGPNRHTHSRPAAPAPEQKIIRTPGVLRRDLNLGVKEGAGYSLMVGAGETYIPAFVLAIGLDQVVAGLIASVPMLTGAILQLASPAAVRTLGSHRRWVVLCVTAQAMVFVLLVAAALAGHLTAPAAFLIAAIYWGAGMASGSAWNTWIGTLVPPRIRARYFARRSRILQLCTLAGFVAGGFALHWAKGTGVLMQTFAVMFAIAGVSRYFSARLMSKQSEPIPIPANQRLVPFSELLLRFKDSPDGTLLLYLLAVQVSVQVAAPYFTPFMLSQLKLSYVDYTWLIAISFLGRILSLPLLGRFAHVAGPGKLLLFCGFAMAPMSAAWIFSYHNLWILAVVQIIAGVVWGGYELASTLLIFERIRPSERTSILTSYNLVNSFALVIGALLGGALLSTLNESFNGYLILFGISSVLRTATIVPLMKAWKIRHDQYGRHEFGSPPPRKIRSVG